MFRIASLLAGHRSPRGCIARGVVSLPYQKGIVSRRSYFKSPSARHSVGKTVRAFFQRGVPDLLTEVAEMPMPPASDLST